MRRSCCSTGHDAGRHVRSTCGAPLVWSTTRFSTGWRTAPPTRSPVPRSHGTAVGHACIADFNIVRCANNAGRVDCPVVYRHRFADLPRKSRKCRPGGTPPTTTRTRGSRRVTWRPSWRGRIASFGISRVRRPPRNGLSQYMCSSGSGTSEPEAGRIRERVTTVGSAAPSARSRPSSRSLGGPWKNPPGI